MRAGHTVRAAVVAAIAVGLMAFGLGGAPAGAQEEGYSDVLNSVVDRPTVGASCNNTDITVTTSNLLPGSEATFTLFPDAVELGTAIVDDDGTASLTFDLPAGTAVGQHRIETAGTNEFGEADREGFFLDVTACTPTGTPGTGDTGDDSLARTGTDVSTPVRAAVVVFAAGAALLLVSRKRQSRTA